MARSGAIDVKVRSRAAILARRQRLRRRYRDLYDRVARLLYDHDPMRISYAPDEYEPEAERILPLMEQARSTAEMTQAVHAVFREMFSSRMAGPRKRYEAIARDLWKLAKEIPPSPDRRTASGLRGSRAGTR